MRVCHGMVCINGDFAPAVMMSFVTPIAKKTPLKNLGTELSRKECPKCPSEPSDPSSRFGRENQRAHEFWLEADGGQLQSVPSCKDLNCMSLGFAYEVTFALRLNPSLLECARCRA